MCLHSCLSTAACAVRLLGSAAATPYPRSNTPPAVDPGLTRNPAPGAEVTHPPARLFCLLHLSPQPRPAVARQPL